MPDHQTFRYVQVPAELWSPEVQRGAAQRVTAKGRTNEGSLTRPGVLQTAVLLTAPFRSINDRFGSLALHPDEVWDLRRRTSHRCHDCARLVEALAEALAWYELWRGGIDLAISTLHEDAVRGIQSLTVPLIVVQMLRRKNKLRGRPALRGLSSKRLRQAYKDLWTVVDTLTVDDYPEYGQVDQHLLRLQRSLERERDARMHEAFQCDGPPAEVYGHEAVYYTLAVILNQLGLEEGTTWYDIAERLRKRGGSAQHPAWYDIADRLPRPGEPV